MDLPAEMTAAFVRHLGGPEEIEIGHVPVPRCGTGDLLVRVDALEVNHVDTFVRSGTYATALPMPFIIGRDFVGRVVMVGEGVTAFRPGDRVWCNSLGYDGRQGSFSEFALAPAERVYQLPPGTDPARAVSLLHTAATAWLGLFREGGLVRGETVFVGGGGGGVGSAAVQLATNAGARVVASTSATERDWVSACGAAVVIDYRDPDLGDQITAAAPDGFDVYWDQSGHHDFEAILPRLAMGGRLILSANLEATPRLPVGTVYTRDLSLHGFAISNASVEDLARAAEQVNHGFGQGTIKPRIDRRMPLSDAAYAHALVEGRTSEQVRGRVVVVP